MLFCENINYLVGWGVCNGFLLTWMIYRGTITSWQQRNLENTLFFAKARRIFVSKSGNVSTFIQSLLL